MKLINNIFKKMFIEKLHNTNFIEINSDLKIYYY